MLTMYMYTADGFSIRTESYINLVDAFMAFDCAKEDIKLGRLELYDDGHDGTREDLDSLDPPVEYSHCHEHVEQVLLRDFTSMYCGANDTKEVEANYDYYSRR